MQSLLEIRNLRVAFPTRDEPFYAVDGIDIDVYPGEILAVVGESGSGKSISMLAAMGLLPGNAILTADKMQFADTDLLAITPRQRRHIIGKDMSMIFQEPIASLNPCFTIGKQIEEVLALHLNLGKTARKIRVKELLESVGINDPARISRSYPHQLSGGQCQRAMIAMAIACNPRLLIADEPTTALDVTIQHQILQLLLSLQEEHGMSVVLITHDMGVVAETADRVMVQYAGKTMEQGSTLDIFSAPQHPYTQALLAALPENATGDRLPTVTDFLHAQPSAQQGMPA